MPRVISVSAAQSQISTDITNPAANGTDVTTVYVTVQQDRSDASGNALPVGGYAASNVTVSVTPSTGVTITQPTGTASQDGTVEASFVSTNATTVAVGATAFGRAVTGTATVVVGGGAPPPVDPGDPFFTDTFALGVRNNADGFVWGSGGSRVTVQLAPDASGDYALRFRFGPDASGSDSSAEQRWNMGRNLTELWLDYYVWIPSNYQHRNDTSSDNNKFFRLWGDDYNSVMKVGASTNPTASAGNTNDTSTLSIEYSKRPSSSIGAHGPSLSFGGAANLGAWNRVRLHYKAITSSGAADGIAEMWIGGTQVISETIDQQWDATRQYWNQGYFFGWSNSGFLAETDFYIRGGANGPKFYETDPGWT